MEESKEKHERQETYALALAIMKEAYREDVITLNELVLFEAMIAEKKHPYWRVSEFDLRMIPKKITNAPHPSKCTPFQRWGAFV